MAAKLPQITVPLFPDDFDVLKELHELTGIQASAEVCRLALRELRTALRARRSDAQANSGEGAPGADAS